MLILQPSTQFKRDVKRAKKQHKDMQHLHRVIEKLAHLVPLPPKYRDHLLTGNWHGYRECHIEPDWLLIYRVDQRSDCLKLMRLGSHANLFNK